jgi:EAL domain-containing protein (putative c-di-GMP-specific phosphodiesterase class I)
LEATLREIAGKLRLLLGHSAPLYHVSETRFSFLLPGSLKEQHENFAALLLARMREPFTSAGITVELEIEAGLVNFPLDASGASDVLRKATSAMHESASMGRSYLWHGSCFDASHRRAYSLLRDVSPGLARGEFRLVFQPKLNLVTGNYSGVEALARWKHVKYGDISPAEFIPLVETTMLIHEFTQWALHTALAQLAAWRGQGITLTMAVNVSSRNLDHPSFVRVVRDACALHGIEPKYLHIECTENAIMTSPATQAALEALRDLGVQISLDDFGMGYSNLSCLSALPVELLKLDQSLIKPIATDPRALRLVQSLIHLGHSLGYRILAEGVETREVFDLVVAANCDAIQGYYLSRPLEASALERFVAANAAPRHAASPGERLAN